MEECSDHGLDFYDRLFKNGRGSIHLESKPVRNRSDAYLCFTMLRSPILIKR